jgi:hypothetical protein
MTVFFDVAPCSLVEVYRRFNGACCLQQMMEAAGTSDTSVNYYQATRRKIPEDSHLHSRRRQNLKSQISRTSGISSDAANGFTFWFGSDGSH